MLQMQQEQLHIGHYCLVNYSPHSPLLDNVPIAESSAKFDVLQQR